MLGSVSWDDADWDEVVDKEDDAEEESAAEDAEEAETDN